MAVVADLPLHRDALVSALRPLLPGALVRVHDGSMADVYVVDVETAGGPPRLEAAPAPVVLWGGYLHDRRVEELRALGVTYYVSTLATPEQVARAVTMASQGSGTGSPTSSRGRDLTPRQLDVLRAYVDTYRDRSRREVAERLGISERTLKVHLAAVRAALVGEPVSNRAALRRAAAARGLLDPPTAGHRQV